MPQDTYPCCFLGVAVYYHLFELFFWEIFDQDGFRQVLANSGLKPEGLASPEEAERVVGCSMGPLDIRWVVSLTMKYAWLIAHTACGSTPPVTTTDSTGAAMAMQQP